MLPEMRPTSELLYLHKDGAVVVGIRVNVVGVVLIVNGVTLDVVVHDVVVIVVVVSNVVEVIVVVVVV